MLRAFAVDKAGAVIGIEVGPHPPGQLQVEAGGKRVALVVVEKEIAFVGRLEIGKTAGYAARALGVLVRVGGVELGASGDAGRVRRGFPATDAGTIDGERKENVGVAQNIVVEKVLRAGAEVGNVERPARQRNGQTEFVLFIALAAQRQEAESLLGSLLEQRTIYGEQWRGLVVAPVESAQNPVEARNADGGADPRIDGIFADGRAEMREPHSAVQGQPAGELVLIFQEKRFHVSPNHLALTEAAGCCRRW